MEALPPNFAFKIVAASPPISPQNGGSSGVHFTSATANSSGVLF